jgi:hypothetical protein
LEQLEWGRKENLQPMIHRLRGPSRWLSSLASLPGRLVLHTSKQGKRKWIMTNGNVRSGSVRKKFNSESTNRPRKLTKTVCNRFLGSPLVPWIARPRSSQYQNIYVVPCYLYFQATANIPRSTRTHTLNLRPQIS